MCLVFGVQLNTDTSKTPHTQRSDNFGLHGEETRYIVMVWLTYWELWKKNLWHVAGMRLENEMSDPITWYPVTLLSDTCSDNMNMMLQSDT